MRQGLHAPKGINSPAGTAKTDAQRRAALAAVNSALGGGAKCGRPKASPSGRGGNTRSTGVCERWPGTPPPAAIAGSGTAAPASKGPLSALGVMVPRRPSRLTPKLEVIRESSELVTEWTTASCACDAERPSECRGDNGRSSAIPVGSIGGVGVEAIGYRQGPGTDEVGAVGGSSSNSSAPVETYTKGVASVLQKYGSTSSTSRTASQFSCAFPARTVASCSNSQIGRSTKCDQRLTNDVARGSIATEQVSGPTVVGSMSADSDSDESSSSSSCSSPQSSPRLLPHAVKVMS